MHKIDKFFDINMVLMAVYSSLETIIDEKNIELIYDIDATIPKELKGNAEVLSHLLSQVLTFVFENTNKKEITLSLFAPKDFLYEESISFEIKENDFSKEKIVSFLKTRLNVNLELLNAEIIYKDNKPLNIHINIPFKLNELGNRRYYRLPDMVMLGKKVLLLCKSQKVAQSIEKMFKYFLYDVTVGIAEYKKQGSNMSQYDILLVENKLVTQKLENLIAKVQKTTSLKYVLIQDSNYVEDKNRYIESAYLIKPVMQESIFDLIILLFEDQVKDKSIKQLKKKTIVNMDKYISNTIKKDKKNFMQKNVFSEVKQDILKEDIVERVVLDIKLGEQNTNKLGLVYTKELNKFLDTFTGSDKYFRQVVSDKQTWQIKEFCIDLEKHAREIGAQSILQIVNDISLLFVYDKLDMLPVYTNKYHVELTKLIVEIKKYLN
jgi:hypothetical protein